jgi:hypothetical protein
MHQNYAAPCRFSATSFSLLFTPLKASTRDAIMGIKVAANFRIRKVDNKNFLIMENVSHMNFCPKIGQYDSYNIMKHILAFGKYKYADLKQLFMTIIIYFLTLLLYETAKSHR